MPLQIDQSTENNATVLELSGQLDTNTAGELEAKIKEIVASADPSIIVDMGGVDFVSSFGLRVIIYTSKAMRAHGDRVVFHSVQEDVMNILRLGGFLNFLKLSDDRASAHETLGS